VSLLHRFDLDRLALQHPDEAVRQLHQKALATGERAILFALAELSYVAGVHVNRSLKAWDPRDARDYYLGSAVYAYLFLFGEEASPVRARLTAGSGLHATFTITPLHWHSLSGGAPTPSSALRRADAGCQWVKLNFALANRTLRRESASSSSCSWRFNSE
jgi:hypothetical protein